MSAAVLAFAAFWFLRSAAPPPAQRPASPSQIQAAAVNSPGAPERLRVKVLSSRPHDRTAYTQGLLFDGGGALYESTGLYGSSSVRQLDPATGEVKRSRTVPQEYFAEGLALVDGRLIQLTWQEQKALVYNAADFQPMAEFRYDGEGWGLCWDGRRLVMSDGSSRLTFRDPKTFAVTGSVGVTLAGQPIDRLNELECVDGVVYANVWQTDDILRIDPKDGRVTAVIDASGLLSAEERRMVDVLNGIAWDPAKKTFLITGKLWPKMFEVTFVPTS
ncbi:MAG TPA: glutaminyl-peptide cyclotransferase [Thermoanaerobaculia bacterium]|nr:glutaminyl-peptide cyclotransferase [Thermoanaerobaculia bacterium]